jgi:DNA-binding NtrC family response regulator
MSYKILIVDNDPVDLECRRMVLEKESDFEVTSSLDSNQAIELVRTKPFYFSAVLMDYRMPKDGITTAQEMLAINPHLIIAMNSADDSREVLKKCMSIGVKDFIEKKLDPDTVRGVVRALCQRWEDTVEIYQENTPEEKQKLMESVGIIGKSNVMFQVARLVQGAAKSTSNVFIFGESGTGKELVAQAIHNLSDRRNKPFVAINVNAIPENLIESHLFGHKKGSFTGATNDSDGLIKSADGGTLFLDEIGDLKLDLQVKLLRVLQERKMTPVGSLKSVDVNIRVISATHVNLEKAILEGKFREDLYYRLHVLPIKIPAVRERREDIGLLFSHFLKMFKATHIMVLAKTIRCLESYAWKGNVRELKNEVERLVSLGKSRISPEDLHPKIRNVFSSNETENVETINYQGYMRKQYQDELDYINDAIHKSGGSAREASRSILQMSQSSVMTRLKVLEKHIFNLDQKIGGLENE